jgi:hypothetical protein
MNITTTTTTSPSSVWVIMSYDSYDDTTVAIAAYSHEDEARARIKEMYEDDAWTSNHPDWDGSMPSYYVSFVPLLS